LTTFFLLLCALKHLFRGEQGSITEINTVGQNTSINRINQKLQMFTDWTATSIEKRQELLISLAGEVWKTAQLVQESSVAVT
jgi:hypothetical protein